ncbi:MAG: hypothetical protein KFH87_07685 [Bacteroidetes bacterium]|nr:hypothetical protein [Bacteroidota bacterium]
MSEWIGIAGEKCITYRKISGQGRHLVAMPPPLSSDYCGLNEDDCIEFMDANGDVDRKRCAYIVLFRELRKMCYTKLIVSKDDRMIHAAKEAGWPLNDLILRMNTVSAIRGQYYWGHEDGQWKPLYRKYYECGLIFIKGCGWYKVYGIAAPNPDSMSNELLLRNARAFAQFEKDIFEEISKDIKKCENSTFKGMYQNNDIVAAKVNDPDWLEPCFDKLTDLWLEHLQNLYADRSELLEAGLHPYAIMFDEPHKNIYDYFDFRYSFSRTQKLELFLLLSVIAKKRNRGDTRYSGDPGLFTIIATYSTRVLRSLPDFLPLGEDYLESWKEYADYVFPDYYRDSSFLGTQINRWYEDRARLKDKMHGAFISMLSDHANLLSTPLKPDDGRFFAPSEVPDLIRAAKDLGLNTIMLFPGSYAEWERIDMLFPGKSRCELFLQYAKEICDIADEEGWIIPESESTVKLYCKHFPDCSMCDGEHPASDVWTPIRPRNFPDEKELASDFVVRKVSDENIGKYIMQKGFGGFSDLL